MTISGDKYALRKVLLAGAGVKDDLPAIGDMYIKALRKKLDQKGSGRIYTTYFYTDKQGRVRPIGKRNPPHQASAPGEPPAPDTRKLQKSVDYEIRGDEIEIGSTSMVAVYQEMGTRKIQQRPWFRNTIAENLNMVTKIVEKGIIKRQKNVARRTGGTG